MSVVKEGTVDTEKSPKCPEPFTTPGKCLDEVRIVFDDQQELFVSQNFLILTSPVFEAMFQNNFKEKQSSTVELPGKKYEEVHEFLMCIHPATLKPVSEANVLGIVDIAEEYQVDSIINSCQVVMTNWLKKEYEEAKEHMSYDSNYQVIHSSECLKILTKALALNYKKLTDDAVETLAKLPHRLYYGSYNPDTLYYNTSENTITLREKRFNPKDVLHECSQMFKNIPAELRCTILSKRLALYRENEVM